MCDRPFGAVAIFPSESWIWPAAMTKRGFVLLLPFHGLAPSPYRSSRLRHRSPITPGNQLLSGSSGAVKKKPNGPSTMNSGEYACNKSLNAPAWWQNAAAWWLFTERQSERGYTVTRRRHTRCHYRALDDTHGGSRVGGRCTRPLGNPSTHEARPRVIFPIRELRA